MLLMKTTYDSGADRPQFQNFIIKFPCTHAENLTEEANFLLLLSQTLLLLEQLHEWSMKSLPNSFTCLEMRKAFDVTPHKFVQNSLMKSSKC